MGILNLFRKQSETKTPAPAKEPDLDIYSGMRVETTDLNGRLLFVAKMMGLRGNTAELYQYSEVDIPEDSEPMHVRIRGYHDHEKKAVYMEGTISPRPNRVWHVEDLTVARVGNDRAFFRLDTNIDATATTFGGLNAGEKPCKLINISVGGACIASAYPYREGDKFLLKVKLLEGRDISAMFCQVLRVIDRGNSQFEYGCRFLELNESDQEKITQNIFAVQRKQRKSS